MTRIFGNMTTKVRGFVCLYEDSWKGQSLRNVCIKKCTMPQKEHLKNKYGIFMTNESQYSQIDRRLSGRWACWSKNTILRIGRAKREVLDLT